jgi:predicted DsbA family dithiol-disulfide isomerase
MDTGTEAKEADMAAISWALLRLVTGWVSELVYDSPRGRGIRPLGLLGSVSSELALSAPQPLVLVPPGAGAGRLTHARARTGQARRPWTPRHPATPLRPAGGDVRGRRRGGERAVSALVEVVHFADPACQWDYSAEPVRVALEERYGAQLRWRTVQVGLHESGASMASRGFTTDGLLDAYRDFRRRFGMPLCTADRPRLHGSRAAARMVKAAEMQGPAAGAALLRRLRLAWFVEVRSLDDPDELLALAAELGGIDFDCLAADFAGATSLDALHADMALARRRDRVALALGKTAAPPGEPGPRFTTPTYAFEAHGRDRDDAGLPTARELPADAPQPRAGARTPPPRPPRPPTSWHAAPPNPVPPAKVAAATGRPADEERRAPGASHAPSGSPDRRRRRRRAVMLRAAGRRAALPACARATGADRAAIRRLTPKRHDAREVAAIARPGADRATADWLRGRAVDRGRVGFGGRAPRDATLERPIPPCRRLPHQAGWRARR